MADVVDQLQVSAPESRRASSFSGLVSADIESNRNTQAAVTISVEDTGATEAHLSGIAAFSPSESLSADNSGLSEPLYDADGHSPHPPRTNYLQQRISEESMSFYDAHSMTSVDSPARVPTIPEIIEPLESEMVCEKETRDSAEISHVVPDGEPQRDLLSLLIQTSRNKSNVSLGAVSNVEFV